MAQSPEQMANTMLANLPAKTGKTLEEWLAIVKTSGASRHRDIMKFLKGDHGLTHGFANLIALKALKSDAGSAAPGVDLVAAQYTGPKAGLRPIYDALAALAASLGKDVEIAPKRAYVSLRRSKQFGLIQPSTRTRVDLGLNLPGIPTTGRLEASGSFNAMVSHRVRIERFEEVDDAVRRWLLRAYELA